MIFPIPTSPSPSRAAIHMPLAAMAVLLALLTLPAIGQVANVEDLEYPPLPEVEIPQPERVVLDNGMVVVLLEDHEIPLVEARALIRTGSRWEPADKVGVAGLTGQVMRSGGTAARASDELDELLEGKAAIVETSIGTSSGSAYMSSLKEDLAEVLEIFAEVLRRPAFEEGKLEVAKNQLRSAIARQNDDPSQIVGREFRELVYGEMSPYSWNETYASVDAIERQDLVSWHEHYFHPDRVILGLVGDFERDAALGLIEEVFGDWARGPEILAPEDPVQASPPGIYYVEKNDVTQSSIRIGHLGIERTNPDFYAVQVMNQVLGGSFSARLPSRVRGEKGLSYNVFGSVGANWDYPGLFMMSMSTKTETTAAGIDALLEEAGNMTSEPPTEDEVERARAAILNSFVFRADSTGEILQQQLTYEYYGQPLDSLERYRKGVEAVGIENVREVAAKYIDPEKFIILVVGPSAGLDRPLADFGEVAEIDVTIAEPPEPEFEVTEEALAQGVALVERVVEAMGGVAAVDDFTVWQTGMVLTIQTPMGEMAMKGRTVVISPEQVRVETDLPVGRVVQMINGVKAMMKTPQGVQPMPDSQRAQLAGNVYRNLPLLLEARHRDDFQALAIGAGELEGEPVERLRIEVAGYASTLLLEPESSRIQGMEYRETNPFTGAVGTAVQIFSDYRELDNGLMVPFSARVLLDGELMSESVYESVEVGDEVPEGAFELGE